MGKFRKINFPNFLVYNFGKNVVTNIAKRFVKFILHIYWYIFCAK